MLRLRERGKVYLVGAGPGDPELITLRGRKLVESADVILYDALVSPQILNWAKEDTDRIFVGKAHDREVRQFDMGAPRKCPNQSEINELMVLKASRGLKVVRLKGGDPLIFGRGGEEAEYLATNKIPFEIIPGVTAAFGAAASLCIPITHRKYASQVALITGHEDPTKQKTGLNYRSLALFGGTLVFYMGISRLEQICKELIQNGKNSGTPCLVIRWATTLKEESVRGTLKDIVKKVKARRLGPPSLFLVGEAARHAVKTHKRKLRRLTLPV